MSDPKQYDDSMAILEGSEITDVNVPDAPIAIGDYQVRLKAIGSNPPSDWLASVTPKTKKVLAKRVWENGTIILGDSIETDGYGTGWVTQVATELGVSVENRSVSATGLFRMLYDYFDPSTGKGIGMSGIVSSMSGFNNLRPTNLNNENHIQFTLAAHRALLAQFFAKEISFPFDGAGGDIRWDGINDWTGYGSELQLRSINSRTVWFRNNTTEHAGCNSARKQTVAGTEELIATLTGKVFAVGVYGADSSHSRFEIYLNNVLYTTYNPAGRAYDGCTEGLIGEQIVNDAVIIKADSEAVHEIKIKPIDVGLLAMVDYIAILKTPEEANDADEYSVQLGDYVYCSNEPNIGYNYPGYETLKSQIDLGNRAKILMCKEEFAGYPILFPQTNKYYAPSTITGNVDADGIHPNTLGGGQIAQSHLEIIQA